MVAERAGAGGAATELVVAEREVEVRAEDLVEVETAVVGMVVAERVVAGAAAEARTVAGTAVHLPALSAPLSILASAGAAAAASRSMSSMRIVAT